MTTIDNKPKDNRPLVNLIYDNLIKGMIETHKRLDGVGCRPVLVMVDEAAITPIPKLVEYAATVRSRGIVLWIAVQDLSQFEDPKNTERAVLRAFQITATRIFISAAKTTTQPIISSSG